MPGVMIVVSQYGGAASAAADSYEGRGSSYFPSTTSGSLTARFAKTPSVPDRGTYPDAGTDVVVSCGANGDGTANSEGAFVVCGADVDREVE